MEQSKFDLRALMLLRIMALFPDRSVRAVIDLAAHEWKRIGIDQIYPHGFCNTVQFYSAVNACRHAELIMDKAFKLTQRGEEIGHKLGDDWREWEPFTSLTGFSAHQYAQKSSITHTQHNLLVWASRQKDEWTLADARTFYPYLTRSTIAALHLRQYISSSASGYKITQDGFAALNTQRRK